MAYTARTRDRYHVLAALTSGAFAVGSLAAAGALTGVAARQTTMSEQARRDNATAQLLLARTEAARTDPRPPVPATVVILRPRPVRTVVQTQVLHRASAPGTAAVGTGGTVSSTPSSSSPPPAAAPAPAAPARVVQAAPAPQPAAPPAPKPAPAPAPSSGS